MPNWFRWRKSSKSQPQHTKTAQPSPQTQQLVQRQYTQTKSPLTLGLQRTLRANQSSNPSTRRSTQRHPTSRETSITIKQRIESENIKQEQAQEKEKEYILQNLSDSGDADPKTTLERYKRIAEDEAKKRAKYILEFKDLKKDLGFLSPSFDPPKARTLTEIYEEIQYFNTLNANTPANLAQKKQREEDSRAWNVQQKEHALILKAQRKRAQNEETAKQAALEAQKKARRQARQAKLNQMHEEAHKRYMGITPPINQSTYGEFDVNSPEKFYNYKPPEDFTFVKGKTGANPNTSVPAAGGGHSHKSKKKHLNDITNIN